MRSDPCPKSCSLCPFSSWALPGHWLLTPLSRQIAMRLGVVDKPNQRKIHLDNKPMMGGLAIYVALGVALLLFSPPKHIAALGAVLAGATALALLGLIDDRYDLPWRTKAARDAAGGAGSGDDRREDAPTGSDWIDVPVTLIWIFAITNAINYLDNMDGQSAGMAAIAAFFFMVIAFSQGLSLVSLLAAAVLGSALGFLVYNFNPSSTFMGDMGALPLGFILAVLAIKLEFDQPLSLRWVIPVFVLALPVFDFNLVTWTRIFEGRSPAEAGKRSHLASHHERGLRSAPGAGDDLRLLCAVRHDWLCWSACAAGCRRCRLSVFGVLLLLALAAGDDLAAPAFSEAAPPEAATRACRPGNPPARVANMLRVRTFIKVTSRRARKPIC